MIYSEILLNLKVWYMIQDNSKDAIFSLLINNAAAAGSTYCGVSRNIMEGTIGFPDIVFSMVLEDYNRKGSEGISSESISGLSQSYNEDYSEKIYKQLRKFKKIRMV